MIEPLPEEHVHELTKLGCDRIGETAMTVLQLLDHPGQCAAVAATMATKLMQLAAMFAHAQGVMIGKEKSHMDIVAGIMATMAKEVANRGPSEKELAQVRRLKSRFSS